MGEGDGARARSVKGGVGTNRRFRKPGGWKAWESCPAAGLSQGDCSPREEEEEDEGAWWAPAGKTCPHRALPTLVQDPSLLCIETFLPISL